jgi:hypothetical protein
MNNEVKIPFINFVLDLDFMILSYLNYEDVRKPNVLNTTFQNLLKNKTLSQDLYCLYFKKEINFKSESLASRLFLFEKEYQKELYKSNINYCGYIDINNDFRIILKSQVYLIREKDTIFKAKNIKAYSKDKLIVILAQLGCNLDLIKDNLSFNENITDEIKNINNEDINKKIPFLFMVDDNDDLTLEDKIILKKKFYNDFNNIDIEVIYNDVYLSFLEWNLITLQI